MKDTHSTQTLIQRSLREKEKKFAVGIFGIQEIYKEDIFFDLIKKLLKLNCKVIIQDNKELVKKKFQSTKKYIFFQI